MCHRAGSAHPYRRNKLPYWKLPVGAATENMWREAKSEQLRMVSSPTEKLVATLEVDIEEFFILMATGFWCSKSVLFPGIYILVTKPVKNLELVAEMAREINKESELDRSEGVLKVYELAKLARKQIIEDSPSGQRLRQKAEQMEEAESERQGWEVKWLNRQPKEVRQTFVELLQIYDEKPDANKHLKFSEKFLAALTAAKKRESEQDNGAYEALVRKEAQTTKSFMYDPRGLQQVEDADKATKLAFRKVLEARELPLVENSAQFILIP